jgi:cytidyltransferase-like protein
MATIVIVSGYFNPLHRGHVRMIKHARELGDKCVVIINNDVQQHLKKGKIIMDEQERLEIVSALRQVDEAIIAVDQDNTVALSIEVIAKNHPNDSFIFANGGDRSDKERIPGAESLMCEKLGIEQRFGVGGEDKPQSSSSINKALGHEA